MIIDTGTVDDDGTGDELVNAVKKINAQVAVLSRTTDTPGSPLKGALYIVPETATGLFATHDFEVAWYNGTTWEFYPAIEGWRFWVRDDKEMVVFTNAVWDNSAIGGGGAGGGGGYNEEVITTIDLAVAGGTTIDMTGFNLQDYGLLTCEFVSVGVVSGAFRTELRVSTDNGVTWLNSSGDYYRGLGNDVFSQLDLTATNFLGGESNTFAKTGVITLFNLWDTTDKRYVGWTGNDGDTSGAYRDVKGFVRTASPVNALQFLDSSSAAVFNSGIIILRGVKKNAAGGGSLTHTELLTNGDFEAGDASGWTVTVGAADVSTVATALGTPAMTAVQAQGTYLLQGGVQAGCEMNEEVTLDAADLNFNVQAILEANDASTDDDVTLRVSQIDGAGVILWQKEFLATGNPASGITFVNEDFSRITLATKIKVEIIFARGGAGTFINCFVGHVRLLSKK